MSKIEQTFCTKQRNLVKKEIESMRVWLDYLEKQVSEDGIISVVILTTISESSMKLIYGAAMNNGALLGAYDAPAATTEKDDVETLHLAICQSVTLMRQGDNHKALDMLRQSLVDYADKKKPSSAPALTHVEAKMAPEPWKLRLYNRADGVDGHYCVGRWNPAGYNEFWNKDQFCSAGELFIDEERALAKLNELQATAGSDGALHGGAWITVWAEDRKAHILFETPKQASEFATKLAMQSEAIQTPAMLNTAETAHRIADALKPYFTNDCDAAERANIKAATVSIIGKIVKSVITRTVESEQQSLSPKTNQC